MKKIASEAPHIHKCDIGGDGLHHVANSFKKAAEKIFTRLNNNQNNIKYKIRSSSAKVDKYFAAAREVGDNPTMPASFCTSRWLDRYDTGTDVITHFDTLEKYYKDAKTPRNSKTNSEPEDKETSECESLSNESQDEE